MFARQSAKRSPGNVPPAAKGTSPGLAHRPATPSRNILRLALAGPGAPGAGVGKASCFQPISAAPVGMLARQPAPSWKTGDVWVNNQAEDDIKNKGGLFSGNDQSHVNVSARKKLAYDAGHAAPEDSFRWSRLVEVVDSGHVKIAGVTDSEKFKVQLKPGSPPVDRNIQDIRLDSGQNQAMGITLLPGGLSPDPVYTFIYYDKNQGVGALTHELFGHEWLALKNAPSLHPKAGSPEEAQVGTIRSSHKIEDPFGNIFEGTVRDYIQKYVESLGSNVTVQNSQGAQVSVPKSPTQNVGKNQLIRAFTEIQAEVASGLTKTTYSPKMSALWRTITANYDLMPKNAAAARAGNVDLTFTQEVILVVSYQFFQGLTRDQQAGFRILLADFTSNKVGWNTSELTTGLEKLVGMAASPFAPAGAVAP